MGMKIQQIGTNMLMVGVLALLAFLVWQRFFNDRPFNVLATSEEPAATEMVIQVGDAQMQEANLPVALSPLSTPLAIADGIWRKSDLKTVIPSRARVEVITYTVQTGDTLFSIAHNFNLKPETLLWGNFEVLEDNPHLLKPNQVLNILPVNGVYYEWKEGDSLDAVAAEFKVEPSAILNFTGNNLDLTMATNASGGILPDRWLVIPGGTRPIKDWGPPAITRQNPASARYYGEGACGAVYEGAYGTGTFVWPTPDRTISGYTYDPGVHPGVDIGGAIGNAVFATDSGVVVYAGWSNYGYGYLIAIDHGNGWQSAYGHLSAVAVSCGQSVYQGGYIGALGSTGNSSGPHLHFELSINGAKVNPLDYIQ
jgi:murein DD-endopeptidase MepM/ murein hydrolase activator NlpD